MKWYSYLAIVGTVLLLTVGGDISRDYVRSARRRDIKYLELADPNGTGLVILSHAGISTEPNEPNYPDIAKLMDDGTRIEYDPLPAQEFESRLTSIESRISALEERPSINFDPEFEMRWELTDPNTWAYEEGNQE